MMSTSVGSPIDMPGAFRSRVAHNAFLSFVGLAIPLALAFFIMPIVARYLGPARFGLLGLAWAITEYLTLFDLGLGRALVKFVADSLQLESRELSELVSLSMGVQIGAGILGGGVFVMATSLLVRDVFSVPPDLAQEALGVFRVVGLSVPVVLLMAGQRSVLEGAQRFDLSTMLKMSSSLASLGIPAIGAVAGWSLTWIMLAILAARLVISFFYALTIRHALPQLRWIAVANKTLLRRILSFGGWVLVSNTVSPLLVYFDRFALGTIAGLAAVGWYTAPYEGVTRLLLIPVSVFASLLPALTALNARGEGERFAQLAQSSERVLAVAMAPPLALIAVFAPELLRVWLSDAFAANASSALRVLAIGVFANSLANPLFVVLYANNRPDLPAKFHLLELTVHVPLTIVLIRAFGVTGAAAGWTIRATLDLALLSLAAARTSRLTAGTVQAGLGRTLLAIGAFAGLLIGIKLLLGASALTILVVLAAVAGFCVCAWLWLLHPAERAAVTGTLRSVLKLLPARPVTG